MNIRRGVDKFSKYLNLIKNFWNLIKLQQKFPLDAKCYKYFPVIMKDLNKLFESIDVCLFIMLFTQQGFTRSFVFSRLWVEEGFTWSILYSLHKMFVRIRHFSFLGTIYLPRVILNSCIFSNRLHNTQNCSERLSLEGPNSDNRVLSPHNKSNMSGTDLRINWLGLQS